MRLHAGWVGIRFLAALAATAGSAFAQGAPILDKDHQQVICPKGYLPFLDICINASTGDIVNPVQRR